MEMNIKRMALADLNPAAYNPRKELKPGDEQFEKLKRSIETFGYVEPIIVNTRTGNTVIGGHQRLNVLKAMGETEAECVLVDLSVNEEKALNVALNKVTGEWDFPKLEGLIADLQEQAFDITLTGFDFNAKTEDGTDFFDMDEAERDAMSRSSEEYQEFVDKFKPKKTTDDCFTPELVYNAIADWVAKSYGVKRENFKRPFYPGGDYVHELYTKSEIVVDNPPFSILSEIVRFYDSHAIKFFLFAPGLTIFSGALKDSKRCTVLCCYAQITYENGAVVPTSFITNLDEPEIIARAVPELTDIIIAADEENQRQNHKELPKYSYPDNVCTAAMLNYMSSHHTAHAIRRDQCVCIDALDAQKEAGKAIYGKGLLLSEKAAAEKAAAEKAAATRWHLSDREKEIIAGLA